MTTRFEKPSYELRVDFGELSRGASCEQDATHLLATRNSQLATLPQLATRPAFTITELLVVIGIIAILVGILLPIIGRVRRAAYIADTENEISQLSNACNQYYTAFNAYPGPLSNDQLETTTARNPSANSVWLQYLYNYPNGVKTIGPVISPVTGTENLVLGLMGGLRPLLPTVTETGGAVAWIFAPSDVGLGPMSLNAISPGRSGSFFPNGSNYLMWTEKDGANPPFQSTSYQATDSAGNNLLLYYFTDQTGVTRAADSLIPEFVDRFPTPGPMPILYLRARTGAPGTLSFYNATNYGQTAITDPNTGLTAQYQYDLGDIYGYTSSQIGLPTGNTHVLNSIGTISWPPMGPPKAGTMNATSSFTYSDGFSYFANPAITPTNQTSVSYGNYSSRPRSVDQFILISAGPDGIYGTADDITSFGSFSQ